MCMQFKKQIQVEKQKKKKLMKDRYEKIWFLENVIFMEKEFCDKGEGIKANMYQH